MSDQLSPLARLRVLVAHLGESTPQPWWPTQFTTYAGLEFAKQSFPRSWASAAINGASRAALEIHDERIGRTGTRHLFRFDGGLERQVHSEILHAEQKEVAALIADLDTAMANLNALVEQTVTVAPGPVQVGKLGQETAEDVVSDIAAHYLDGFEKGVLVFPYFAGGQ